MPPPVSLLSWAALVLGSGVAGTHAPRPRAEPPASITRDVVIVGGGASGAHAAVRLRDMGKTVVVVEKQGQLGGHTETYWDPDTGNPINVGVQGWVTYRNATDFVTERMNVSTTALAQPALATRYVDFATGAALDGYVEPAPAQWLAALETYLAVCERYQDLILPGYFGFPAPGGIPADLTMPFGAFVAKHGIAAAVPKLFELTGMGVGDMLATPTVYVMQAVGAPFVSLYFGGAESLVPASGDVHELYDRVGDLLGGDVLYNTTVVASARGDDGVRLVARGADGRETHISAGRLLVAVEPSEENMGPFDLDGEEAAVFGKFQHSNVYVGAVRSPALPVDVSLTNMPASAAPSNWTDLPLPSFDARFDYFGRDTDLFRFLMVGTADLDADGARGLAVDGFDRMVDSGVLAAGQAGGGSSLEFAAFKDHGPMHLRVGADELEAGFVQDLYALQGRRSTWYTGAAWSAQFTTVVWAYNDILLPKLVADME